VILGGVGFLKAYVNGAERTVAESESGVIAQGSQKEKTGQKTKTLNLGLTRSTSAPPQSSASPSSAVSTEGTGVTPLVVPDFSNVKQAHKNKAVRAWVRCQTRDGQSLGPNDLGFEACMQSASQERVHGANIVHPVVEVPPAGN
jgi:hypothetical protein